MELALGRGNAVDLGFQEGAEHGGIIVAQAEPNLTNAAQHPGLPSGCEVWLQVQVQGGTANAAKTKLTVTPSGC